MNSVNCLSFPTKISTTNKLYDEQAQFPVTQKDEVSSNLIILFLLFSYVSSSIPSSFKSNETTLLPLEPNLIPASIWLCQGKMMAWIVWYFEWEFDVDFVGLSMCKTMWFKLKDSSDANDVMIWPCFTIRLKWLKFQFKYNINFVFSYYVWVWMMYVW